VVSTFLQEILPGTVRIWDTTQKENILKIELKVVKEGKNTVLFFCLILVLLLEKSLVTLNLLLLAISNKLDLTVLLLVVRISKVLGWKVLHSNLKEVLPNILDSLIV